MQKIWLTIATVLAAGAVVLGLPDHCRLEPDPGHCGHDMEVARWYYNVKAGTCVRFLYNGCGGNSNNFRSRGACLRACTGEEESEAPSKTEDSPTSEDKPFVKVVKTIENDDSDIDLKKLHIDDANDLSTLEQLIAQDNIPVEEVVPLKDSETQEESSESQEESSESQEEALKITKTVTDDSDVDFKKYNVKDARDRETLEHLLAQENMEVQEIEEETKPENEEDTPLDKIEIVSTEEVDEPVDVSKYTSDPNDASTMEDLLATTKFDINEIVPASEEDVSDDNDETSAPENQGEEVVQEEKPFIKVVETVNDDESDVDFKRLGINDENDMATLEQLIAQDNIPVEEVFPLKEQAEESTDESNLRVVDVVENDESEADLDRMNIDNINDKVALEDILAQENLPVREVSPAEETEEKEKPFIKVIETVKDDESDVDFKRLGINDENDRATLEQLIAQDNIPVEEVFPLKEQPEESTDESNIRVVDVVENDESEANLDRMNIDNIDDKVALEEILAQENLPVREVSPVEETEEKEKPFIKIVETVNDDESDVDFERLGINDENDMATLEQLIAQDNIPVEEVFPLKEQAEESTDGSNLRVVDVVENDESEANLDRMNIDNIDDKVALEEILAQENLPVREVTPVEENEEKGKPFIKVVETVNDDESDVDFKRLGINDENDMATLEQLIAQDNIPVEEVFALKEQSEESADKSNVKIVDVIENDESEANLERMNIDNINDKVALEDILAQENLPVREVTPVEENEEKEKPFIKVVETVNDDESDVDFKRLQINDENDMATLEQLIAQDNIPVEEVFPLKEEKRVEQGNIKVVSEIDNDESDIDFDRLSISNANDKATLEDLIAQENFPVNEVVPAEEEKQSDRPFIKVVETVNDDESDVDFKRLHIDDENDLATLEQLIAQDNIPVEEVLPLKEAEDALPEETEVTSDKPMLKVINTVEDDTDIDMENLQIDNELDKATLEQLMAQGNLQVQEIKSVDENDQENGDESGEETAIKVVNTIDHDTTDVNFDQLHINNPSDKYTLDNLLAQDNIDVQEIGDSDEKDKEQDKTEAETKTETKPFVKVVETIDDDESEVDFERLHITDENDKATLEQLIAQDNIPVEEIVPVLDAKKENKKDKYEEIQRLRNKYRKSMPFQFMKQLSAPTPQKPIVFFNKKVVTEVEDTTETSTHYLKPMHGGKSLPHCCTHPVESGPCNKKILQWYYDPKLKTCVTFTFGGCGGNRNRFDTIGDCLRKCGGITHSQPRMMRPRPSLTVLPMLNPYKALLSGMSPRMKPMMPMFHQRQGPDMTTTIPTPTADEQEQEEPVANQKSAFLRILFMPKRPMPMIRNMDRPHPHPMTINKYKKMSKVSNFAPRFHKEVVMAPETHDNRFQSHSMPNNKVFVNKRPRGFGRSPHGRMGHMRRRGPMRPGMRAPPRFWPRFDPPKHYPRGDAEMDNHVEIETTTYPPDYPKWPKNTAINLGVFGITKENRDSFIEQEEAEKPAVGEPNYACLLPVEAGPCKALDERWYFDKESGKCSKFYYGGCRGNANRFETEAECKATCMTTSPKPDDTTPYPDDVIVVTENVYGVEGEMEDQNPSEETKEAATKVDDVAVTPDPKAEKPVKEESEEASEEKETEEALEEQAEEVGRLEMSSEVEYIIIITVMALVGIIVIILVTFSVAHLSKRCRKGKKDRIVEAVIASSQVYNPDFPKLVYYGNTIVPPKQSPDVPDVHTLNKLEDNKEDV